MAAYYGQSLGRASLGGGSRLGHSSLPNGACGYRDLNAGPNAPRCGCRRFWLNNAYTVPQESERAYCFCSHHACFHESSVRPDEGHAAVVTGEAMSTEPVHAHHGGQYRTPSQQHAPFVAPTWSELVDGTQQSAGNANTGSAAPRTSTGLGIRHSTSQFEAESINTRLWDALNGFARQQQHESRPGDDTNLPSTAVPSIAGASRASPSRTLQGSFNRPMAPPVAIPQAQLAVTRVEELSATEVATPSVQETPNFRAHTAPAADIRTPPPRVSKRTASTPSVAQHTLSSQHRPAASEASQPRQPPMRPGTGGPSLSIQEMCNTIQDYGRRISMLESVSFDNMPSHEIHNNLELIDGRLLDLEHWRTDRDKAQDADDTDERLDASVARLTDLEAWREEAEQADAERAGRRKKKGIELPDAASFDTDGSFDMSAAAQTEAMVLAAIAANAETRPRIDSLEMRIEELEESTLPSATRPWSVEVVLLPFGCQLPGLWFSAAESSQYHRRMSFGSDEWPDAQNSPRPSFRSAVTGGSWTTESIEAWADQTQDEWLSPKACGPTGTCFQRLASRGLVRDLELKTPDAGGILRQIQEAFGSILNEDSNNSSGSSSKYQGLLEPFVPLRKVRKSSRLRFLSPAEMITPALWRAEFLESSVFMKTNGERRLYITTPLAYQQYSQSGWTWRAIRQLPTQDVNGEMQEAQAAGRVMEACWSYNDRLDHAASLRSSFASRSVSSDDLDAFQQNELESNMDISIDLSAVPTQAERRSVSLPSSISAPVRDAELGPKRRVASFDMGEYIADTEYSTKRRRLSSSPEVERRGFAFTPRYSREPQSPHTSADAGIGRSSQAASSRGRGTTPFAYATPHSDMFPRDGGDTEIDDGEGRIVHSEMGDDAEEWEGMQDVPPTSSPMVSEASR